MDNNITETHLRVVSQKGMIALLAMLATMAVNEDGAQLYFKEIKKGEKPSIHGPNFEVKEYYPEGLYLFVNTTKSDSAYGYLQDFIEFVGNYMTSDDPEEVDDDEFITYEFRLTDKIDETTHKLAILPF